MSYHHRGLPRVGDWQMGAMGAYFTASRVTPTASEIRPVNMAVRYLIRARP
jgi:hypothetical protein